MHSNRLFVKVILWINWVAIVELLNDNPLLLLISLDGFRYDLLNATTVPNIWKFASENAYYKGGCRPQYLSFTAPNHASIATGLLVESHGIVGNYFHDRSTNTTFDIFNSSRKDGAVNDSLVAHFYNGEPIWLTNERAANNRRSATMYWPTGGGHWPPEPHKPTLHSRTWMAYKNLSQWMVDFDEIFDLFTRKQDPYNFVAWYISEPDHVLHSNGFKNGKLEQKMRELDLLFKYVRGKLENELELFQRLNIILTADHGHAQIEKSSNVLCISEVIGDEDVIFGDQMIYTKNADQKETIYTVLKNAIQKGRYDIDVYKKEDIPKIFAYSNNDKIGDIIAVPRSGYNIRLHCSHSGQNDKQPLHASSHGLDPNHWTMKSVLVMKGPTLKQNHVIDATANNIDLYPLMCHILGLIAAPNNGSLENMLEVLRPNMAMNNSLLVTETEVAEFHLRK
ncbi:unnamed protein product [Thelazia callipaeda]|uniref:Bis(5'-adenosyl)-triphosphatase n=1 Tax=Thelazia callipaeda TaxID=103827 RepID=A0A158RCQ8_THECL|nr:unnamed protein product [Thelazia callipaeda]